jgi:hypothetical protein
MAVSPSGIDLIFLPDSLREFALIFAYLHHERQVADTQP